MSAKATQRARRRRTRADAFAKVLVEARQKRGIMPTEMARIYGAAPSVISRIESGRCQLGEATVRRYAKALGLRVQLRLTRKR